MAYVLATVCAWMSIYPLNLFAWHAGQSGLPPVAHRLGVSGRRVRQGLCTRRYHYKVVWVRAESLRPLEPPGAYAGLPRRVRGVAEHIRDVR